MKREPRNAPTPDWPENLGPTAEAAAAVSAMLARFGPAVLIGFGVVVAVGGPVIAGLVAGCEGRDCGDPTTLRIAISGAGLALVAPGLTLKWRWRDRWGR
jgi:hypothetical protein